MKKLYGFLIIAILLMIFSIQCFAYEEINIDIKNVQETEVSFIFNKESLNNIKIESSNNYNAKNVGNNISLSFTVSNVNFAEDFNRSMEGLIDYLDSINAKAADELRDKEINIQSSFHGYPFGGRTTLVIKGNDLDNPININAQGTVSLNDGDYHENISITPNDEEFHIEYGTNTASRVNITISPQSNYKTVYVRYDIYDDSEKMKEMSKESLELNGFEVINQTSTNLSLNYTYSDLGGFNHLFNLDLFRLFNVVANVNLETHKSLMKGMHFTGAIAESEIIDNINLTIEFEEKAIDNVKNIESESHTWDISKAQKIDVEYNSINLMTLVVLIIVPISIAFVFLTLYMLNKRGSHIRFK